MKTIKNELIWFIAITFIITYAIGFYILDKGGLANPISRVAMYIPALTVLGLYLFKFKKPIFKKSDLGLNFKGLKYWIITPLALTGLSFLTYGISYLFNPDMFETTENIISSLDKKGFYWGNSIALGFLAITLLNSVIGSIFNIPMFIGEELGWRAFMVPRLLKLYSPAKAFLIGAIIWAMWHAVMIAEGLNYPNINPILGILLMIAFCLPVGIIIQYFYVKTKSILVAALAHAALNKSAMSMAFLLSSNSYDTTIYGPTGLIGIVVFAIAAYYLYQKADWKKENTCFANDKN